MLKKLLQKIFGSKSAEPEPVVVTAQPVHGAHAVDSQITDAVTQKPKRTRKKKAE